MISGGDHLEWPPYEECGTRRPTIEKEMDMEQAFDEAMWGWVLEQGPPQDDDVVWLKHRIVHETLAEAARQTPEFRADIMGFHADIAGVEYMTKFGKVWADSVHDTLVLGKLVNL